MQVGDNIYRLRTAREMSQEDLAAALNVSRQSVSKWETGGATPELEKLIRMSQLFQVSLDELVGETPANAATPTETDSAQPEGSAAMPGRKIAGTVLFALAGFAFLLCTALAQPLIGLILALPFLLCGGICFLCPKRPGLWCGWTVFGLIYEYLYFATGMSLSSLWLAVLSMFQFSRGVVISAALWLVYLILVAATCRSFRGITPISARKGKRLLAAGWVLWLLLALPIVPATDPRALWYRLATHGIHLARVAGFAVLAVLTWLQGKARYRARKDKGL